MPKVSKGNPLSFPPVPHDARSDLYKPGSSLLGSHVFQGTRFQSQVFGGFGWGHPVQGDGRIFPEVAGELGGNGLRQLGVLSMHRLPPVGGGKKRPTPDA